MREWGIRGQVGRPLAHARGSAGVFECLLLIWCVGLIFLDVAADIIFVDDEGAGIDKGRQGRVKLAGEIFGERREGLMVEVVEAVGSKVGHRVGTLADGGGDESFLNPFESAGVGVHGDDGNLAAHVGAVDDLADFGAGDGDETDESIDLCLGVEELFGGVECDGGISFDIDGLSDLDAGVTGQDALVAGLALREVQLIRICEHDHVALLTKQLDETLATQPSSVVVISADEEETLAGGRVGIDRDDGDALFDGGIDVGSQKLCVGRGHEDAGGLAVDGGYEFIAFCFGVVRVGTDELRFDLHLGGGVGEAGGSGLPIRIVFVGRNKDVGFIRLVRQCRTARHQKYCCTRT